MVYKKLLTTSAFLLLLFANVSIAQEQVLTLVPFNGDTTTFVNWQIIADTTATSGLLPNRVYELQRDAIYLQNVSFTVLAGETMRMRAAEGTGEKPILYLYPQGFGPTPTRPPGNMFILNGGNLTMKNFCVAGFYEPDPDGVDGVQGGLINTTGEGSTIILDRMILSNINGQHVRTGQNSVKVQITNCIFANMGALTTSNLGAGKGIDLREKSCDTLIIVNNTFVNYQDRALRHYNFSNPTAGTGAIKYGTIDHNTFINGMGFHGLLSLGNLGYSMKITNNLFVDAFALGEDSTDVTRSAEWANTGEYYPNGNNRITWIFCAPNDSTNWTISNNYYSVSTEGQAWLNDDHFGWGPFGRASQLSWHINSRLGADSVNAFVNEDNLALNNIPNLMTNMMTWYENPAGGNRTKNTPGGTFNRLTDDYDRRLIQYYRDTLNATYPNTAAAYTGSTEGWPVGDLNWFPEFLGVETIDNIPSSFELYQNYPNPFNPNTIIRFKLEKSDFITLSVFNVLGQKVATLVSEDLSFGTHQVTFDATSFSSGVYFYMLESGKQVSVKKMMLLK